MATFNPSTETFNLLIIDPQVDFCEGGNLAVIGANADIDRISKFITNNTARINHIFVSLDTHTNGHMGHKLFKTVYGKQPTPLLTFISKDNKITYGPESQECSLNVNGVNPTYTNAFAKYIQIYNEKLVQSGQPAIFWPRHCIQDTDGWKIHPTLRDALKSIEEAGKVSYHIKGQNQLAEMYSIMKAEVPVEDIFAEMQTEYAQVIPFLKTLMYDPTNLETEMDDYVLTPNDSLGEIEMTPEALNTYTPATKFDAIDLTKPNLQTTFNAKLYNDMVKDGLPIVVCGEAKSHCVRASTRDIVEQIKIDGKTNKVILISNGSSPVTTFEEQASNFQNDMQNRQLSNNENTVKTVSIGDNTITFENLNTEVYTISQLGGKSKKSRRNQKHNKQSKKGGKKANKNNKKSKKGGKKANKSVHKK